MSDKLDLNLNLDIAVNDEDQLVAVRKEMQRLAQEITNVAAALKGVAGGGASFVRAASGAKKAAAEAIAGEAGTLAALKRRFAFEQRMTRQRDREQAKASRDARQQIQDDEKRFKAQFDFNSRMAAARERSAKSAAAAAMKADKAEAKARGASIREAARQAERAAQARARAEADAERQIRAERRESAAQATRQRRDHERAMERASRGAGQVRQGVGQVAGYGAAAAGALSYGAARAIGRGVSTRMEIDSAETAIRMFNDVDDGKGGKRAITGADIKKLRRGTNGLDSEAIKNGTSISAALEAYNEIAKAGLMDPMEQTRTLLSATSALELDPRATTKLLGTMARNMGKDATPARLKKTLNAVAIGAREDPTQANEIVEGMNRAQSVLAMSQGFTEEDLVGLVSGGQSVGIQPGKAGTFISALARDILQGNSKFLDPHKRKQLNFSARKLGFGSAKDMAQQFAGPNGKAVLYQIFGALKNMAPEMRSQVANALSGGMWGDEDLQMVNGLDAMKNTDREIHDPKNANFLDEARNKRMQSWKGIWDQSRAIFSLFWESFGSGFDSTLREINSFFLDLNGKFNYDSINDIVRDSLDGLRDGLGFKSWKEALSSIIPSDVRSMGPAIRDFFRGFGEGIQGVASTIRSVASFFGGGDGAQNIGRLAGGFLSLSVAAVALAPVLGVITGLTSVILGMVGIARAASAVAGGAGAGAAGGIAGAGVWASIGGVIGLAFLAKVAETFNVLKSDDSKGLLGNVLEEFVPAPLRRWLDGSKTPATEGWVDPPAKDKPASQSPVEKLKDETAVQTDLLRQQLELQRESLQLEKTKEMSDKARTSSGSAVSGAIQDAARSAMSGSVGSSEPAGAPGAGGPLPGTGMRRRGIIGGGAGSPNAQFSGSNADAIKGVAQRLGISAKDLSTIISYETGGTFDPSKRGGKGGRHLGLIQFGAREQAKYGVHAGQSFGEQMGAVENYLRDRGVKPGMGLNQLYATVNGGNPYVSQGASDGNGTIGGHVARMQVEHGARAQAFLDAGGPGSAGGPVAKAGDGQSVGHMDGQIQFDGQSYDFGSGGHKGANSIPQGTYPITPDTIGPWGRSHGALGINNNAIWDKTLGRMRTGIEFHAASSASKLSAGCIAIARGQYARFRSHVLEYIKQNGQAWITIGANGHASITSTAQKLQADAEKTQNIADEVRKPPASITPKPANATDDLVNRPGADPAGNRITNLPGTSGGKVEPRGGVRNMNGASSGSGGGTTNNITVNAANHSPEEMANAVQRKLQDSMNRRTHDYEGFA